MRHPQVADPPDSIRRPNAATPPGATVRSRGWKAALAGMVMASASAAGTIVVTAEPAMAKPAACGYSRVDDEALTGYCRGGSGQFRFFVQCAIPLLPDYEKHSPWTNTNGSATVRCNWGNHAKSGSFALSD